jgi:hypothetical protein
VRVNLYTVNQICREHKISGVRTSAALQESKTTEVRDTSNVTV